MDNYKAFYNINELLENFNVEIILQIIVSLFTLIKKKLIKIQKHPKLYAVTIKIKHVL